MLTWLRLLWISGLLLPWTLPTQATGQDPADPSNATAVFHSLETAWSRGDVDGIAAHLGKRRVSIALPDFEPGGGSFSRSQTLLILEGHFHRSRTLQFQFLDIRPPETEKSIAVALALRRYRVQGSGPIAQDRVLVTLAREGSRWVIAEITALE